MHQTLWNAPKHEFRVQWGGSGALVAKCSCHEVASEFFATNAPDPPPLHPKLMFWCISYYLGAFATSRLPYKTRGKTFWTSAKVRAMTSCWNFLQRTHLVVWNAPKHEFRVQWSGLGAFVAKCSCHEVALEFFATNAPDPPPLHPKHMFWCVLYHLGAFGTVKLPYETRGKTFRTSAKVRATKLRRIILQRTHLIHPIGP